MKEERLSSNKISWACKLILLKFIAYALLVCNLPFISTSLRMNMNKSLNESIITIAIHHPFMLIAPGASLYKTIDWFEDRNVPYPSSTCTTNQSLHQSDPFVQHHYHCNTPSTLHYITLLLCQCLINIISIYKPPSFVITIEPSRRIRLSLKSNNFLYPSGNIFRSALIYQYPVDINIILFRCGSWCVRPFYPILG